MQRCFVYIFENNFRLKKDLNLLHLPHQLSTVVDLVVPVPVSSGSVSKTIAHHKKLSPDSCKSNSASFEVHNCRPKAQKRIGFITIDRHL